MYQFLSVLWIRTGFNADTDPEPPFYLDAESDPGSRTYADQDPVPGQTLKFTGFFLEIIN
jgi:hypothetical protein